MIYKIIKFRHIKIMTAIYFKEQQNSKHFINLLAVTKSCQWKKKSLDSVKASKICYVYAILNTQTTVPKTTYKHSWIFRASSENEKSTPQFFCLIFKSFRIWLYVSLHFPIWQIYDDEEKEKIMVRQAWKKNLNLC